MAAPKSADMREKPFFARVYAQCHPPVQQLFDTLHDEAIAHCPLAKPGFTNKPDFRLSLPPTATRRWQTFCELVLEPTQSTVQCNLRIDGLEYDDLQRRAPALSLAREARRPEETLITFPVTDTQITPAVALIVRVYAFHSAGLPANPEPTPAAPLVVPPQARLRVGGKIRHATWGIGTIQTLIERGQLLRLTVDFPDHGPKTFPFNHTTTTPLDR